MLTLIQKKPEADRPPKKAMPRSDALLEEMSLFISLSLARFIVWRALRVRRRERAARLRVLKLINGGGLISADNQALSTVDADGRGMLREAMRSGVFWRRG